MSLGRVLAAMEQYVKAKNELQSASLQSCSDWDCGIASELGGSFATREQRQRLQDAEKTLEVELNAYIDARVRALLKESLPA